MASEFAHQMRKAELGLAVRLLPPRGRVLELGAGDGWQSRALNEQGFDMTAVDVDASRIGSFPNFPVALYDGSTLPYPDASFDAIYSSNVMEHVADFERVQNELARVLRPNGYAVHCVPSAVWRFWTTLGHPLHAARSALAVAGGRGPAGTLVRQELRRSSSSIARVGRLLRLGLLSPRHGEHGSFLGEHFLFSRRGWLRRFEQTGWVVRSAEPTGIFYSGNELWGTRLGSPARRTLARFLGSSTLVFMIAPREGVSRHDHQS